MVGVDEVGGASPPLLVVLGGSVVLPTEEVLKVDEPVGAGVLPGYSVEEGEPPSDVKGWRRGSWKSRRSGSRLASQWGYP